MTDDRRNIKLKPGTFNVLKNDKPDGVTWDYYLRELHAEANDD